MSFYKIISAFIELPGIFILLAFLLFLKRVIRGRREWFLLILICLGYFLSTEAGAYFLGNSSFFKVEEPAPTLHPQAIVVLGGGTLGEDENGQPIPGPYTLLRLRKAYTVWKEEPLPVIVTGEKSETETMAKVLQEYGIPENHIIIENRSQTTWDNASFTGRILREKNWTSYYLVSSQTHLPRAILSFRTFFPQGEIAPIKAHPPYHSSSLTSEDFLPSREGLSDCAQIFHEWIGYLVYALRARRVSPAPFPADISFNPSCKSLPENSLCL